jgi:hypothetical protein
MNSVGGLFPVLAFPAKTESFVSQAEDDQSLSFLFL